MIFQYTINKSYGNPLFCQRENKDNYGLVGIGFNYNSDNQITGNSEEVILFVNVLTQRNWIQSIISGNHRQREVWPINNDRLRFVKNESSRHELSVFMILMLTCMLLIKEINMFLSVYF